MTCENEASPSINSASPGAAGSTDTAAIVGDDADRSTTTTLASRAIRRASVSAVRVMLSPDAVPRIVTLRAASPALRKSSASCSISVSPDRNVLGGIRAATRGFGFVEYRLAIGCGESPQPRDRADRSRRGRERGDRARRGHAQQFAGGDRAGAQHQGRQRRDQHDRQLLRIGRSVGNGGAGNDAAVGRRRVDVLAGIGLAIFRQIGFQQIALRLGFTLERAKLDVLAVGRGRLLLQLIEAGAQAVDPAAGDAGIIVERTRDLAGFVANLAVEIGKLRLQFLDARMVVEQRR